MAQRGRSARDSRIEALLAERPERFVAARDALARDLAASNDPAARMVQALKRPTRRVWLLNQLARRRPDEVAALVEAGVRLRRAHAAALAGRRDAGLRAADDEVNRRLGALVRAAAPVLAEAGYRSDDAALIDHVRSDLRVAVTTGAADAEALRRGVLDHVPRQGGGDALTAALGGVAGGGDPAPPRRSRTARVERRRSARAEADLREARRAMAAAESELGRRERAARKAEAEAVELRRRVETAELARNAAGGRLARAEAAARALART